VAAGIEANYSAYTSAVVSLNEEPCGICKAVESGWALAAKLSLLITRFLLPFTYLAIASGVKSALVYGFIGCADLSNTVHCTYTGGAELS